MSADTLIRGGIVVTMAGTGAPAAAADVLVQGGRITAIGPGLEALHGSRVIDAGGYAVLPGLIDTHRHLWYTPVRGTAMDHGFSELSASLWGTVTSNITPEDMYIATRAGILDALSHGITTVLDYCHAVNTPEHADRAVQALLESPGRVLFCYGPSLNTKFEDAAEATSDWSHAAELRRFTLGDDNARVTLGLALQSPALSTRKRFEDDVLTARSLGVPITAHVSPREGGPAELEITAIRDWGLLGSDMHLSHCCGATDDEYSMVKEAGATITVSPMAEAWLGQGVPPIARMRKRGLEPAVGADAVCSSSGDLFEEARAALLAARLIATDNVVRQGRRLDTASELGMSTGDALKSITVGGAVASSKPDLIGTLEVGKAADIILVRLWDDGLGPEEVVPWVVSRSHGSDVHTVMVDGEIVKHDGRLVDVDPGEVRTELTRARKSMLGRA